MLSGEKEGTTPRIVRGKISQIGAVRTIEQSASLPALLKTCPLAVSLNCPVLSAASYTQHYAPINVNPVRGECGQGAGI